MTKLSDLANLSGRNSLVTGAAGSLGSILVDTLAELGSGLILVDRNHDALNSLASELTQKYKNKVWVYHCDLEKEAEREGLANFVSQIGSLSVLLNNAAFVGSCDLVGWAEPFESQKIEAYRRSLEVNLTAPFHLSQLFLPIMRKSPSASIINVSSIYGRWGPDWRMYDGTSMANPAGYASSKGGLLQLTRWLATTVAPSVRVNAIAPGGIFRGQPDSFCRRYADRVPMRRMATEEDFRGVTGFLASEMSSYMTGQVLYVDGGWGVW